MTCIVGLQKNGTVWMGGDSAGTNGSLNQTIRADKKVFIRGDFIFGFSGSFRTGDLLKHSLQLPEQTPEQTDLQFMVNDFVNAIRKCLEAENKHLKGDDKLYPYFLVGYKGNLYTIQSDYQVAQSLDGFDSVGSGSDIAKGSMYVNKKKSPRARILEALEASAKHNAAVRGPFTILSKKA